MANRYWVGGTGNWDAATTTNWAATSGGAGGASVPTSADSVIFDAASNATLYTVTVTASATCLDLTVGAPASGKITFAGSSAINIAGNLSFSGGTAGITYTYTGAITMSGASATYTINLNGIILNNQSFIMNGVGSTFQLTSAFTTLGGFTLTNGTFDGNSLTVSMTGVAQTISGNVTFYNLTRTGSGVVKTSSLSLIGNITVTNNLVFNGNSAINRLEILSSAKGTPRTITAANVSCSYLDMGDITGAGAGSWNLSAITGLSGDCGGNSGITFTTAATQTATGTTSFSWSNVARWTSRIPLPQDDVVINNAFGTSQTITADMPRLGKSIDFTGTTWTTGLTFAMTTNGTFYGSFTLISGLTLSGTSLYVYEGRGTSTLTTFGLTFARSFTVNCGAGTLLLGGNFTMGVTNTLRVTTGTLDTNGYVVSAGLVSATGGTLTLGSVTHLITGVGSAWSITGTTLTAYTGTIKFTDTTNSALTFAGGNKTYYNVWFSRGASTATNTISGSNTFYDFRDDGSIAHTIAFTTGTTQTVTTFTVSGTAGQLISINSTTTGTHTLVKTGTSYNISRDYLNIQHSIATPSSTWFAGVNSTNNQGVATAGSGWIFNTPAPQNSSNFFF